MITESKRTLHPMMYVAGAAIILFCAAGTAAIMGWIPNSMGQNRDSAELAAANQLALDKAKAAEEKPHHSYHSSNMHTVPERVGNDERRICGDCGVIESVQAIETRGQDSGMGAAGGAVVGGLLGHQVGGGRGKEAMTVVGVLGGALAGNQIEKNVKSTTSYDVVVRMDNGSSHVVHEANQPSWRAGDHVKVIDGAIRSS
jgi:outer membrane lipoprotein SlyB